MRGECEVNEGECEVNEGLRQQHYRDIGDLWRYKGGATMQMGGRGGPSEVA